MLVNVYIDIIDEIIRTLFERIGAWTQESAVLNVCSMFVNKQRYTTGRLLFSSITCHIINLIFGKACYGLVMKCILSIIVMFFVESFYQT